MSYYHDVSPNSTGKLVVAKLPIKPEKHETELQWSKYYDENGDDIPLGETKFNSVIYGDMFNFVELDPSKYEVGNKYLISIISYIGLNHVFALTIFHIMFFAI